MYIERIKSLQSSPYIHPFITALQSAGHLVSVCLPHQQRSWIGKAHFLSQVVRPFYYTPSTDPYSGGHGSTTDSKPSTSDKYDASPPEVAKTGDWVLLEGTPATCTQLGLFHLFKDRPPVNLVVSGPNYGRNVTALFSLSSGTLGGALEAATFRYRAIALSFAFWDRNHDPKKIGNACNHSVKLIQHLYGQWGHDVDLYSINVPLVDMIENNKVMMAPILQNTWRSGSCYEEVSMEKGNEEAGEKEQEIREGRESHGNEKAKGDSRSFRWQPKFSDIGASIDESQGDNDGWAIKNEFTSVTPLKANFMPAPNTTYGELKM